MKAALKPGWAGNVNLSAIANQLHDLGFRQLKATSLKQKHVQALVDQWLRPKPLPRHHQEPHELFTLVGREG